MHEVRKKREIKRCDFGETIVHVRGKKRLILLLKYIPNQVDRERNGKTAERQVVTE